MAGQVLRLETRHRALGPLDRAAKRMPLPVVLAEQVVHQLVRGVLDHPDLLEDDFPFLFDIIRREARGKDDVGEQIDGDRQVLVEDPRVEAGVFLAGEGIHLPADGVDDERDLLGGPSHRPLEDKMLDEVADAVHLRRLMTGAGPQPDPQRNRTDMRHGFSDHGQAIAENLFANHPGWARSSGDTRRRVCMATPQTGTRR